VAFGETVVADIAVLGELDSYSFTGTAGDVVRVRMADGSSSAVSLNNQLDVFDPAGMAVGTITNGVSALLDLTLPATGTYLILASDVTGRFMGNYGLSLQRLNNPGNVTPISFGETVSGSISALAEMDTYVFTGSLGDQVQITVTQTSGNFDPQIQTYRPDGSNISDCSDSTTGAVLVVSCTLDVSGDHAILVSDVNGDESGNYDLNLELLNGSPLTDESGGSGVLGEGESESTVSPSGESFDGLTQSGTPTSQGRPSVQVTAINGNAIEVGQNRRIPISLSDLDDSRMLTVELAATNVPLDTSITIYLYPKGKRKDRQVFEAASLTGTMAHSTSTTTMTLPDDFVQGYLRVVIGDSSSQKKR
jgi:hypothetical protein